MTKRKENPRTQRQSAKARREENKQARQEALRDQLASMSLLQSLDNDLGRLDSIVKSAARAKTALSLAAKRTQIMALRVRVQVTLAKLNKVLPDLKSTDLSGSLAHVHYNPTPADRQEAAYRGLSLDDFMEQKMNGELEAMPELPPIPARVLRYLEQQAGEREH